MIDIPCWGDRGFALSPATTALLVIDMQRDFLDPDGMCAQSGDDVAPLAAIVPTVGAITAALRGAGCLVVHTREGYASDLADVHPAKRERSSVGTAGPLGRFLIRGEAGHDFVAELAPAPGEPVIDKPGFGAFYRTGLEDILRARGVEALVITGVTTQCCVATTLREAVDRGYRCLSVADGCAAIDPALHDASLAAIQGEAHLFGWIADSGELLRTVAGEHG